MFGLGGAATKQAEAVQQTNAKQGAGFQPVNSSGFSNEKIHKKFLMKLLKTYQHLPLPKAQV